MGKNYRIKACLIFYFLILFTTVTSTAQTDYRNGYIVTNDNDTVQGQLNYKGVRLYESIDFRQEANKPPERLGPEDIKGYGFSDDKVFRSYDLYLTKSEIKRSFLEVLVHGGVSLFKHKKSFYISKQSDSLFHLTNESKETYIEGEKYFKKSNQYISVLNMLLFDCIDLRSKIAAARLMEVSLTKLVEAYNQCTGHYSISFKSKKRWLSVKPGLIAGLNISNIDFKPRFPSFSYLSNASGMYKFAIFGLAINISAPRLNERVSFDGGVTYNELHLTAQSEILGRFVSTYHDFTLKMEQIRIPTGIKYLFPNKKITPYLIVGLTQIINLNRQALTLQQNEIRNTVNTTKIEPFSIPGHQASFHGAVGIQKTLLPKLDTFLQLRIEKNTGITESDGVESNVLNFQILLGTYF